MPTERGTEAETSQDTPAVGTQTDESQMEYIRELRRKEAARLREQRQVFEAPPQIPGIDIDPEIGHPLLVPETLPEDQNAGQPAMIHDPPRDPIVQDPEHQAIPEDAMTVLQQLGMDPEHMDASILRDILGQIGGLDPRPEPEVVPDGPHEPRPFIDFVPVRDHGNHGQDVPDHYLTEPHFGDEDLFGGGEPSSLDHARQMIALIAERDAAPIDPDLMAALAFQIQAFLDGGTDPNIFNVPSIGALLEVMDTVMNAPEPDVPRTISIESLPRRTLESEESLPTDDTKCTICMGEYAIGDTVTTLPCCHTFHTSCIGLWFAQSVECPICRVTLEESVEQWQELYR